MIARRRTVLALLAATLLVAGCSNHSGLRKLRPTDEASTAGATLPDGIAGSPAASTKPKPKRSPSRPSTSAPGSTSAAAATTRSGARHHQPRGGGSTSTVRSSTPPRSTTAAPPPDPSIAGSPASGLQAVDVVRISGLHFRSGESVSLQECLADGGGCSGVPTDTRADSRGAFAKSVVVANSVRAKSCAAHGCTVVARGADGSTATAAISFG